MEGGKEGKEGKREGKWEGKGAKGRYFIFKEKKFCNKYLKQFTFKTL